MDGWVRGLIRLTMGVGIGGVLLAVIMWPFAFGLEPAWIIPLLFYGGAAMALIGLAAFGITRYFAKPS